MNILNLIPFALGGYVTVIGLLIVFVSISQGKYSGLLVGLPLTAMGLYAVFVVYGDYIDYLLWLKTYGEIL